MYLVVDANIFFAALIKRGVSLDLFFEKSLRLVAPSVLLRELEKHREEIVRKSGLSEEEISSFVILLGEKIQFFDVEEYASLLKESLEVSPDPDDVDYLALAMKLRCPLWSHDKRLAEQDAVQVWSTSDVLESSGRS